MQSETGQFNDGLLLCQKRVSIYKALNGNDVKDMRLVVYLNEMAQVNFVLKKLDDAVTIWNESLKILKAIPRTEESPKWEAGIKQFIERAQKDKGAAVDPIEVQQSFFKRILPNTTGKMLVWASVFAGIAGFAAYSILKKR